MTDNVRHNPLDVRGGHVFTIEGRDPAWTNRVMGDLWSHATSVNLKPTCWNVGLFNLRDVIRARDPHFQERDYAEVRLQTVWGCHIRVVSLFDTVELEAVASSGPDAGKVTTFVPEDHK